MEFYTKQEIKNKFPTCDFYKDVISHFGVVVYYDEERDDTTNLHFGIKFVYSEECVTPVPDDGNIGSIIQNFIYAVHYWMFTGECDDIVRYKKYTDNIKHIPVTVCVVNGSVVAIQGYGNNDISWFLVEELVNTTEVVCE